MQNFQTLTWKVREVMTSQSVLLTFWTLIDYPRHGTPSGRVSKEHCFQKFQRKQRLYI